MTRTSVAIIGAGLAGLNVARLLHRARVDFRLFEARGRAGGRILAAAGDETGFDLGPSWVWPRTQPALRDLLEALGLKVFAQASAGDALFERSLHEGPLRIAASGQEAGSMRIAGGTSALVRALLLGLPQEALRFDAPVTALRLGADFVELRVNGVTVAADCVIVAVPPRLFAERVALTPAPDPRDLARWRGAATWMAPHAKFIALYDRPFWREAGLSGHAQSMVGPLAEVHDATTASGSAALFGFVGIPAAHRATLGEDAVTRAATLQLSRLFGPEAALPRATFLKDWAADPWTATAADSGAAAHPAAMAGGWVSGAWSNRLILAASEASPVEPGYLGGAVEASVRAVAQVRGILGSRAESP